MRKLISFNEAKNMDELSQQKYNIPALLLMERAGLESAEILSKDLSPTDRVLVLCGSGNNGGDAYVLARELYQRGFDIIVGIVSSPKTELTKLQYKIIEALEIPCLILSELIPMLFMLKKNDWIVDGITGIGLNQMYKDPSLISSINKSNARILAIDVPTGLLEKDILEQDTNILSDNLKYINQNQMVRATITVTMGLEKTAMYISEQRNYCGKIIIANSVFPKEVVEDARASAYIMEYQDLDLLLPRAYTASHKYTRGSVVVVAGSQFSPGAAILASQAASKGPAGIVHAVVDTEIESLIVNTVPSVICGKKLDTINTIHAMMAGSGWSLNSEIQKHEKLLVVTNLLNKNIPLVLDADAIGLYSSLLKDKFIHTNLVLTPHLGELMNLAKNLFQNINKESHANQTNTSIQDPSLKLGLQENKQMIKSTTIDGLHWWSLAQSIAESQNIIVCAKNTVTFIASPNLLPLIIDGSNTILATAGSGDVLAGLMASSLAYLIAQYDKHRNRAYLIKDLFQQNNKLSNSTEAVNIKGLPVPPNYNFILEACVIACLIHTRAAKLLQAAGLEGDSSDLLQALSKAYTVSNIN